MSSQSPFILPDYFNNTSEIAALPLADSKGGRRRIIGTATRVLTGVFLTAKHLLEQYIKDYELIDISESGWSAKDMDVSFELEVLQFVSDSGVAVWHITKIHIVPNSDLAILVASRCSGDRAEELSGLNLRAQVNLHMPPIGSRIVSLGYPSTTNTYEEGGRSVHTLAMQTAEGVVEDIDTSVTRRSPRFQTNAPVDGGMSGGPVFNEEGRLCGINSTAIPPTTEHPFYTSFVIPLHTAFGSKIAVNRGVGGEEETSLLRLGQEGTFEVFGLDHFIAKDGDEMLWDSRNIKCDTCK